MPWALPAAPAPGPITVDRTATLAVLGVNSAGEDGIYRDAVTGNEIRVHGGSIAFAVAANSVGIYVLNGVGRIGESGLYLR